MSRSSPSFCSVPLDPATLKALQPTHDVGDQAIRELDAWNTWSVQIARLLSVSCADFKSDVVAEQYGKLRERITQALNVQAMASAATDALALCHQIEKCGCSPELTEASLMASRLRAKLSSANDQVSNSHPGKTL